ncbi:hypothetical protein NQ314_009747 [Rhamnusium bicolor]|uniref:Uncharacterized protein n=1 Tax=Rhamnusium bicolor TaxID=1586634 RepID=A0AAV8XWF6_9CUCU|nr:hypothetical protein NQ314_009747 [Rhamnusium bicolor]
MLPFKYNAGGIKRTIHTLNSKIFNNYLPQQSHIVEGVGNAALSNSAVDTLLAGLIYHAACQIKILKDNLTHLGQRAEEQVSTESEMICIQEGEELKAKIIYKKICQCIDHYDAIYEFVKDLEETYSLLVFSQFFASIIVICVCSLQLSISNTITTAIYMSEWYNFDQKSKKALITLMERAKRPMMVTAGKILDLSLATFTMIIRRSYSLLAVLENYE